ncbi:MAG: class I SAM-dependent methyltransferase [Candidatus Omnitrophica bacterium]|nr:class I SAM-dependent methyltransferase [Candidatus Omnitrophota bacterium]
MTHVFDRYYKKYDAWYDRHRFAFLSELEAIKKVLPRDGKGLEIGVGTGRFAAALGITTGIDPSRNMLEIAQERGVNVRFGFGEDVPFLNDTFDRVAIIITLCFVKDPQKVLKEAKRVLKKSGRIIIGIIDKDSFLGKFYQRKKSIFYKRARFFSVKEAARLLKEAGFINLSYYQTLFRTPDKVDSIEKPKRGFGKGGFVAISGEKR